MLTFVSTVYAVFASENLLTRVRFLELRNHLGKSRIAKFIRRKYQCILQTQSLICLQEFVTRTQQNTKQILLDEGYIASYKVIEDEKQGVIRVTLKYGENKSQVITGLRRVSKPGLRIYSNVEDMPKVMKGLGIAIVSTSKGIMTDREARKQNVGGEVLAFVW